MTLPAFLQKPRRPKFFFLRRVEGESMLPAFKPGKLVVASGRVSEKKLAPGQVAIIKHAGLEKIKRIQEVRDGRVFVVGDNEDRSTDSRTFGWLPFSAVRGIVRWPKPRPEGWRQWLALAFRLLGVVGTVTAVAVFIKEPSWPTPDKLLVFLTLVFMMFGQAWQLLKRLLPFVAIMFVYESFRGLVPHLNTHVHYTMMADFDKWLFGGMLPTVTLQKWLWHGSVSWYDFAFYGAYMMHFVWPVVLALFIWKKREHAYWKVIGTYVVLSYLGFLTYLLYPAAPPWMSSDMGIIDSIHRVSSSVWSAMGIHDFPSLYNNVSPNPVAAVPSLHAAYATVFAFFVWKYFGKKWGMLACIHPFLIYMGTVYMGEHYAFDELLGGVYGLGSIALTFWFANKVWPYTRAWLARLWRKLRRQSAVEPEPEIEPAV